MTKKEKAERYDSLAAKCQKYELAIHDLSNGGFKPCGVRVNPKEFDANWEGGFYQIHVSLRAMPLFSIKFIGMANHGNDAVEILTEAEIQDGYRAHPLSTYWRVAMQGYSELMERHFYRVSRKPVQSETAGAVVASEVA